jgi:hypothetical protein
LVGIVRFAHAPGGNPMKHIVQVIMQRDLSNFLERSSKPREGDGAEENETDGDGDEGEEDEPLTFQDTVCTLGPYGTLEEAEAASDRVLRAFARAEQEKISFEYDELEDEVGAILQVRDYLDTEDFIRRRKAGELTAEELEEFNDD